MHLKDNSQDKKYFTIIPNYIANHSTANDQALYFQMKRLSGDNNTCYASEKYFKSKLGIGSKALKKSLDYLLDKKWIAFLGFREIETPGGKQKIKIYSIKDIWKMNIEHFDKGLSEREPLLQSKGVSESNQRGVQKEPKGSSFEQQRRTTNKNYKNNNNICLFDLFWKDYPVKENKKKAREVWVKKNLDTSYEKIIAFIKKAKNTDRWNKKIIPHPTTFLNGERWEDDLTSYGEIVRKPFYRGDPLVEKNGKQYVISDGQWLEFAGDKKDLVYK